MYTTILQVPFAKFLIPVPYTLHTFGVETRIDHFEVETYFALLIFSNVVLLVRVPFLTRFNLIGDDNVASIGGEVVTTVDAAVTLREIVTTGSGSE